MQPETARIVKVSKPETVLCAAVRTAIGTYHGTLENTPATALGAVAIKATLERAGVAGADVGTVVIGQRDPGRQQDEPCASGWDWRRVAGGRARDDGQPGLRIGGAGHRFGRARGVAGQPSERHWRWHGEHGHGALPDVRRALGLPDGRCADL